MISFSDQTVLQRLIGKEKGMELGIFLSPFLGSILIPEAYEW